MGTASAVATNPLNRIPIFMNRPRREMILSFDIFQLLMLRVIRNCVRLARILNALRSKPCHYVGHFLVRHGLVWDISAPVRRSQFGTADDDNRAQPLIADQREKRIVGDCATLWASVAARAMARFAVSPV